MHARQTPDDDATVPPGAADHRPVVHRHDHSMTEHFEPPAVHALKNHVSVIIVMCDLMLEGLPDGQLRTDLVEIQKAATAAIHLVPRLRDRES